MTKKEYHWSRTYLLDAFDDTLSSSSFLSFREGEEGSWNRTVETHSNKTFQYIDGLNPYTVYLFRVAAENALGYSKPGKESYPTLTLRERKLVITSVANYLYFTKKLQMLATLHSKLLIKSATEEATFASFLALFP